MAKSNPRREAVLSKLPPELRRRLGRVKRAVLDQPEPKPKPSAPQPAPQPERIEPIAAQSPAHGYDRIGLRRDQIFADASRDGLLLEIGPAHNGTVARRHGFNTRNVDYLDREGLVEKYKDFKQYNLDDIEDVDYVLGAGSTFSEAIDEKFDVVVASHVLEHSISLVDFINDLVSMLNPDGQLALVVPDHRFCFDRLRERTSLGSVIDTIGTGRTTHTPGTLIEYTLNAALRGGRSSWPPAHGGPYRLNYGIELAKKNGKLAEGPDYMDVHHWIFSPNHLRLLLSDLADLGYIDVRESHFHPTVGHEFFINLSREGKGPQLAREELLKLADEERRTLDDATIQVRA